MTTTNGLNDYAFDTKSVWADIDGTRVHMHSVRTIREALKRGAFVEIKDEAPLIISPYCYPDEGEVVYFNVRTPTEWWGRCSKTNRRVIWKPKTDSYVLEPERTAVTPSPKQKAEGELRAAVSLLEFNGSLAPEIASQLRDAIATLRG